MIIRSGAPSRSWTFSPTRSTVSRPLTLTVRTDEPNTYYWLGIGYNTSDHWSTVRADFNPQSKTVALDVFDERVPSALVYVTLDLNKMGLPTGVSYTVEDTNLATGEFRQYPGTGRTDATADGGARSPSPGRLSLCSPAPQTLTLRQGEGGYQGVQDTYIETFDQTRYPWCRGSHERIRTTAIAPCSCASTSPRCRSGKVIKSAQLKLYAHYKWGSARTLDGQRAWPLGRWDAGRSQLAPGQRRASPGPSPEPGERDQDYDWTATSQGEMNGISTWYSYNVTDLVRQWLAQSVDQPWRAVARLRRGRPASN